jgi:polyhydroxyalkanoate synthesis regulator phasin
MNQIPTKNEWLAFERAFQTASVGEAKRNPVELRLSGTHTQSAPFLHVPNKIGVEAVQFAVNGIPTLDSANSVTSKKILAAKGADPDPTAALAAIRKLLVGPTRNLHDAMFEEIVTILEESNHEVQQYLCSLNRQCAHLSDVVSQLATSSLKSADENHKQANHFQEELQKQASIQQDILSDMFLAIDSKLQEMARHFGQTMETLAKDTDAHILESTVGLSRNVRETEAKCLDKTKKAAELIEARLDHLERKSAKSDEGLNEVFSSGLLDIVDRLKVLR